MTENKVCAERARFIYNSFFPLAVNTEVLRFEKFSHNMIQFKDCQRLEPDKKKRGEVTTSPPFIVQLKDKIIFFKCNGTSLRENQTN